MKSNNKFLVGQSVVYPSHGVGVVKSIESQLIGEVEIQVYVVSFPQNKMTLRVPVNKAAAAGLRKLVNESEVEKIYSVLQSKPKKGNKMWSRRAQEYESKINSGDILAVAEVVRDLYKETDSNRSYSERSIYELALNRLANELAILEGIKPDQAIQKFYQMLKFKFYSPESDSSQDT